jgi:hypothetical protein
MDYNEERDNNKQIMHYNKYANMAKVLGMAVPYYGECGDAAFCSPHFDIWGFTQNLEEVTCQKCKKSIIESIGRDAKTSNNE